MEEKVFKPAIFRAAPVTVSFFVTCTAGLALVYYYLKSSKFFSDKQDNIFRA